MSRLVPTRQGDAIGTRQPLVLRRYLCATVRALNHESNVSKEKRKGKAMSFACVIGSFLLASGIGRDVPDLCDTSTAYDGSVVCIECVDLWSGPIKSLRRRIDGNCLRRGSSPAETSPQAESTQELQSSGRRSSRRTEHVGPKIVRWLLPRNRDQQCGPLRRFPLRWPCLRCVR